MLVNGRIGELHLQGPHSKLGFFSARGTFREGGGAGVQALPSLPTGDRQKGPHDKAQGSHGPGVYFWLPIWS